MLKTLPSRQRIPLVDLAETLADEAASLPLCPRMADEQHDAVIDAVGAFSASG